MRTFRILISSPGDVLDEREKARQVIKRLERNRYAGRAVLEPVLWEDLPLQADMSFQQGIEIMLSRNRGVDFAIFILWSRLGSPLGPRVRRLDGSEYRSGTEREFDLMLQVRKQSLEAGQTPRPAILAYHRQDSDGFQESLKDKDTHVLQQIIEQRGLAEAFIREEFEDENGRNLRAYHTYARPVEFSGRLRIHLIDLIDEMLGMENPAELWEGSPYVGLEAFDFEQERIFHGREREVCELGEALRAQAEKGCASVLILGPSGSGKSSLARAGLLPAICQHEVEDEVGQWRRAVLCPGEYGVDLISALVRTLSTDTALPELRGEVDTWLEQLADDLRREAELTLRQVILRAFIAADNAARTVVHLVLLIDQVEGLFTTGSIPEEMRVQFFSILEMFARSGRIWVVMTARSDFYAQLQAINPLWRMKQGKGQYDLLPVSEAALRRIIREPARMAGLSFESGRTPGEPGLDEMIFADALQHPESLPHLQFLLRELYERRKDLRLLTYAAYESLGGVQGVLARRAEGTFEQCSPEAKAAFSSLFRALVSVRTEQHQRAVRRSAPMVRLSAHPGCGQLMESFVEARLLTTDRDNTARAMVSVGHEALLSSWLRLSDWIDENRKFLKVRARTEAQAREWQEASETQKTDLLLTGLRLAEAEELLSQHGAELEEEVRNFITRSADAARARQEAEVARLRKRNRIAVSLTALALAAAGIAAWQWQGAAKAREKAEASETKTIQTLSKADADAALGLASRGEDSLAYAHAVRALERNADNPLAALLAYRLLTDRALTRPAHFLTHESIVTALVFSRDGRYLATGCDDGSVWVADLKNGDRFRWREKGAARVVKVAFSPDNQALTYGTGDEFSKPSSVYTWEFRSKDKPRLVSNNFPLGVLALAWPLPKLIVAHSGRDWGSGNRMTQGFKPGAQGWELVFGITSEEAENSQWVEMPGDFVSWVSFAPAMLIIHDPSRNVLSWHNLEQKFDFNHPQFTARIEGNSKVDVALESGIAVVSPKPPRGEGEALVSDSGSWTWFNPQIQKNASFELPAGASVNQISPDGNRIAISTADETQLYDRYSGKLIQRLREDDGSQGMISFSQDGSRWMFQQGKTKAIVGHLLNPIRTGLSLPVEIAYDAFAFDPTNKWVTVAGKDKNVRVWALGSLGRPSLALRNASTPTLQKMIEPAAAYELVRGEGEDDHHYIYKLDPHTGRRSQGTPLIAPETVTKRIREQEVDVTGHSFSPDWRRVVVTYGNFTTRPDNSSPSVAVLYDTATGQMIGEPLLHNDDVFSPSFAPDGKWFVTISDDRTVRRADGQTGALIGEPLRPPRGSRFVKISPKGDLIITGSGSLIDVAKWRVVKEFTSIPSVFDNAFFSPDQLWLVSVAEDLQDTSIPDKPRSFIGVCQWDLQSGLQICGPLEIEDTELTPIGWLHTGQSIALGASKIFECKLPCPAEALLPWLKAYRPVALGEDDERIINTKWSVRESKLEGLLSKPDNNPAARKFATSLLSADGL